MNEKRFAAVALAAILAAATGCRTGQPIYDRTPEIVIGD